MWSMDTVENSFTLKEGRKSYICKDTGDPDGNALSKISEAQTGHPLPWDFTLMVSLK